MGELAKIRQEKVEIEKAKLVIEAWEVDVNEEDGKFRVTCTGMGRKGRS